jgi:nucleoid-associated protein YgaU
MARHRRIRSAFWLFLLLLGLGAGWAAYQEWPRLALFESASEPREQEADREVAAERSADQQPARDEPKVEGIVEGPGSDEPAAPSSDSQGQLQPDATRPGAPPEQAARESAPAADAPEDAAASEQAQQPGPAAGVAGSDLTPGPRDAEVAATEPAAPNRAAPRSGTQQPAPAPDAAASDVTRPSPEQEPARDEAPAGDAEGSGQATAPPTDAPPTGAEATAKPSFDIVRVERDGRAVIAGRAAPGAEVEVRSGGQVIDRVRASRRGEWVATPAKPLAPGDQELSAVVAREGAAPIESDQVVVVAVPGPTSPAPATAKAETSEAAQPVAVLLPREGKGTGRILQAPGRLSADGTLALMTVSYDETGEVLLSGEAPPGVPVRIYVDNRPAALVVGDAKGTWSSGLGEALKPGTYTLRLDQLDAKGQPVARLETPFTRVSEPPVEGNLQVDYVVVQPGNSLWRIARRLSGKGVDYVHIHGANQAQIRDPDLIYPGQVFEIPARLGSAG